MGDLSLPLVEDDFTDYSHLGATDPARCSIADFSLRIFVKANKKVRDLTTVDGAVPLAFVASIGNLLQGWDNDSIAGAMFYIKEEFNLSSMPMIEGSIMAMALLGATLITTVSGVLADKFGRWMMLLTSAILSFISALLVIFWSHHVYMLLFTRLIEGFSIGLAVTLVPLYICETAPSDIRGKLNTFPQLSGSAGMFLSYCVVFWISLMPKVDWRVMLGIQSIPSFIYSILIIFYLPESPSWLVSQGRVNEARKVLQRLRKKEDVSGEMANLLEGIGVGHTPCMEEYLIRHDDNMLYSAFVSNEETIKLYGLPENITYVAFPFKGQNMEESALGTSLSRGASCYDPIISLIESVHETIPEESNNIIDDEIEKQDTSDRDEENQEELRDPELENNKEDVKNSHDLITSHKSGYIGGGWHLAWKLRKEECFDGQIEEVMERVYFHEGGVPISQKSFGLYVLTRGNFIQATALVNKSVFPQDQLGNRNINLHSLKDNFKTTKWKDLLEPGVMHALIVGVGIQILQQLAGINGILYYTPQILDQAGVVIILSKIGINSSSASILMSAFTTLLMLPFICIAMWLMDRTGRRRLLIVTIPILLVSLIVLVVVNTINFSTELHALLSTVSVGIYFCVFVMGFGPIPNIFCSEIFPTRVRAICLAICSLTFWVCDIIVTYTLPVLLSSIGLAGVFGIYGIVCILSFIFVCLKVPETKGIPIEVMAEFYALGASGNPVNLSEEVDDMS